METVNNYDNLTTLREMLLDEQKLVTYVSLSKEMCIHVNQSKALLNQIVQDLRNKDSDIQLKVNYIISGLLDDNRASTIVCGETELDDLKNKFKIVFYQHLYSVSMGASTIDNVSFMAINKFEDFPLCNGLIKSNFCVKRTSDEIGSLKTNSQEIIAKDSKPSISVQKKVKEESKIANNVFTKSSSESKNQESKPDVPIKLETVSPKKEPANNNVQKSDRKNGHKAQKGIAGFFNKPAVTKQVDDSSKEIKQKSTPKNLVIKEEIQDTSRDKIKKMDLDEDTTEKEVLELKKEVKEKAEKEVKEELKKEVVSSKNKNKKLNHIKNNAKVDKKRKRVLHVSDSENDEEKNDPFADDPVVDPDSEDEIPPTPLVNTVKITSGITNPKKRRKIINKTYTDEDGYLLTKKEEVYESCSDNENEGNLKENVQMIIKAKTKVTPSENKIGIKTSPPDQKRGTQNGIEVSPLEKKSSSKNGKKKIASPQKGKQATLMSFFKKV